MISRKIKKNKKKKKKAAKHHPKIIIDLIQKLENIQKLNLA